MVAVELFDVVAAGAFAACAWGLLQWLSRRLSRTPKLLWQHDEFNSAVMSRCPALRSYYKVPALLANRHVETIFAAFFRQVIVVACQACHSPACRDVELHPLFKGWTRCMSKVLDTY